MVNSIALKSVVNSQALTEINETAPEFQPISANCLPVIYRDITDQRDIVSK